MGVRITVDDRSAQRLLKGMQRRSVNMRPVLKDGRDMLEQANRANFAANGLPSGSPWAARRREEKWPLMRRTGKLFNSLSRLRGSPNDIGLREATFGTNVEYAGFHQNGTRKMPKRLIVFEPIGFKARLSEKAASHIVGRREMFS